MTDSVREYLRHVFTLPLDEQREALLPGYRKAYDAYGRDWEANTAAMADDYVFRSAGSRRLPGFGEFRGREGYLRAHREMLEVLDVERVVLDDVRPIGEGRVVALLRFVVRAGDGTVDQQFLDYHEYRDGELIRQTVWFDREEGLRDLGLD